SERVLELGTATQRFVFEDIDAPPVPSLLRGLSAPAILDCDYAPEQLALLLRHDADGFNRWDAGQQLAARAFDACLHGQAAAAVVGIWCAALAAAFADATLDPALLAELLTPPAESELGERLAEVDPAAVHAARESLLQALATHLGADALQARYAGLHCADARLDAVAQARRRLCQRLLELLAHADPAAAQRHASTQYAEAGNMTARLGALRCLLRLDPAAADTALAHFRQRYAAQPLALDKWFAIQALVPGDAALSRVQALLDDPAFTLRNPNRARAVLGSFAQGNPSGFHRSDGAGYVLLAGQLAALDALNPQTAARVATAFNGWKRLEPRRREAARAALAALATREGLSPDLADILDRALHG
ncbi:MAG TPA: DUF3458 domain-containing protein, partial [Rhodanobacteraceae bacterium]|nr:DUF3458 domain-containing protein [Rhodanobacteraceae bacterium]